MGAWRNLIESLVGFVGPYLQASSYVRAPVVEATNQQITHVSQAAGGGVIRSFKDSGEVDVATDGATTAITLNVPPNAQIVGYALKVVEEIAGIDATTGTLSLTGGNTQDLGTISAFAADTSAQGTKQSDANFVTSDTTNAQIVLSGGTDQTPSGGKVRVVVIYDQIEALA